MSHSIALTSRLKRTPFGILACPFACLAIVTWFMWDFPRLPDVAGIARLSAPAQIGLLATATFVSEDLACIAAGQWTRVGALGWFVAIFGSFMGIYLGDLGLYVAGRIVGDRFDVVRRWRGALDGSVGRAVFVSRVVPGTRLPLYLAAGALRVPLGRFAGWTFLAVLAWAPLLVLTSAAFGVVVARALPWALGAGTVSVVSLVIVSTVALRAARGFADSIGRSRLIARVARLWRWEFWPAWLFYVPLLPWIAYLSIRHRGFTTITAANPGIPHGGFVGESKAQILASIKSPRVLPWALILTGDAHERTSLFADLVARRGWTFPPILKPDAGERGAGVRLARSIADANDYLASTAFPVLLQVYHPGPYEAGIFYVREPGEPRGRIFSITDKVFPELVGDGESTIEQLAWRHPRFRMQADTFLARHHDARERVLAAGETFRLAMAGNHCQGTLFRDGSHLITPALERAIDDVAQTFDGFHFGRFDVRYADVERFMAGKDFAIVELNGVTSESTNLYDPSHSLLRAYRILFRQWSVLFRIGAASRRNGHRPSTNRELLREIVRYYRATRPPSLAD